MSSLEQAIGSFFAAFFAKVATQIGQRALASDPNLHSRLSNLEGNVVQIECTTPTLVWHLRIEDAALVFVHGKTPAPNVIVSGTLSNLAGWLMPGRTSNQVAVQGDDTLLLEMIEIIHQFQPDLENELSRFLGQPTASTMLGSAEMGLRGIQSIFEGITRSAKQQTGQHFLQHKQFDILLRGIDQLRLRVDRLSANITAQEQKEKKQSNQRKGSKAGG